MSFRGVFIAVVLSTAMVVSALVLQSRRPRIEVDRPTARRDAEAIEEPGGIQRQFVGLRLQARLLRCAVPKQILPSRRHGRSLRVAPGEVPRIRDLGARLLPSPAPPDAA